MFIFAKFYTKCQNVWKYVLCARPWDILNLNNYIFNASNGVLTVMTGLYVYVLVFIGKNVQMCALCF